MERNRVVTRSSHNNERYSKTKKHYVKCKILTSGGAQFIAGIGGVSLLGALVINLASPISASFSTKSYTEVVTTTEIKLATKYQNMKVYHRHCGNMTEINHLEKIKYKHLQHYSPLLLKSSNS